MEKWLLVDNGKILDECYTYRAEDAENIIFKQQRGWMFSETAYVISEADFINELQLNAFESENC